MKMKYVLLCVGLMSVSLLAKESITPEKTADFFYQKFGDKSHPHKKINHTKGFCVSGEFIPRDDIKEFVHISLLSKKEKVLVRYSIGGGDSKASDKSNAHGFALKIGEGSDMWDFATINTAINAAKTPDVIVQFLGIGSTSENRDKELKELIKKYPSIKRMIEYSKTIGVPASLANTQFNSQHTYGIVDNEGKEIRAKVIFVPQDPIKELSKKEAQKVGDNFLEERFRKDLKKGSVNYYMYLVVANPGDVIDDISEPWSNLNKKIFLGTIKLDTFKGDSCNLDVFSPGVLPDGVKAPLDPVFEFRKQLYNITHQRRE